MKWDSSSWQRGRICQVPVPFLFTDWRRDCAPTDGAPHNSDNRGKEKGKKRKPTRWITFIVHANETECPENELEAVIFPQHENTEVYLIYDRISRAEQGKIDELSLSAGANSFSLRRRRNVSESKGEGAADNGCEPSSRWWMTRLRVWLVFYLLTRLSGMQGDWWAAESWPGAALFGRHSMFLGQSALWVKYT